MTQPPQIRHQVLESSDGLEVLEIGLPAEHMTTLDHAMKLPTGENLPGRNYHGQRFSYHQSAEASWQSRQLPELMCAKTDVLTDSGELADVQYIKSNQPIAATMDLQHRDALRFYYVTGGQVTLSGQDQEAVTLQERDSFVLPPEIQMQWHNFSAGFQCIEFTLKA